MVVTMDGVKPQGGYLAKRCPEAYSSTSSVHVSRCHLLQFREMLAEGGIAFEAEVFERITEAVPVAVVVDKVFRLATSGNG